MPRKFQIKDANGTVIGRFTAPDGATDDQIKAYYTKARQTILEKRAATHREAVRTEPAVGKVLCPFCRRAIVVTTIGDHIREEAVRYGIDVGEGPP